MDLIGTRPALVAGLVLGAAGIAVLWAGGQDFPVAVPPGLVILLVGAGLVSLVPARWTAAVGGVLGLFVLVGFLVSGTGFENVAGDHGGVLAVGQAIEVVGVLVAASSGALVAGRRG